MKFNVELRLRLTLSKIIGGLLILVGSLGFLLGLKESKALSESIFIIGIGAGMIGYKQHLTSKSYEIKSDSDNSN